MKKLVLHTNSRIVDLPSDLANALVKIRTFYDQGHRNMQLRVNCSKKSGLVICRDWATFVANAKLLVR